MQIPEISDIQTAYQKIEPYIHKTPVFTSTLINRAMGCQLFFKAENMQRAGAFKYRGATHAILNLSAEEKSKGVATHSSGNHAGALAKAALNQQIPAYIVMPKNAPNVKVAAVKSYGGNITFCEPTLEARESTLEEVVRQTGATFIHPYHNFNVICGQGTACLELSKQIPEPDIILAPVGGGGLLSGTAISANALWNKTLTLGAEPLNANDAWQSFQAKRLIPVKQPNTIADGLRTSLSPLTFQIISDNVNQILTVSEDAIKDAMLLMLQHLKIVVEPSSAVPLAAIAKNKAFFKNKTAAIIITGGNVDFNQLPF